MRNLPAVFSVPVGFPVLRIHQGDQHNYPIYLRPFGRSSKNILEKLAGIIDRLYYRILPGNDWHEPF